MSYNQLSGSLPDIFDTANGIVSLILGSNQLTGTIPLSVSSLTAMTYLSLNNNHYSGTLPTYLALMTAARYACLPHSVLTCVRSHWWFRSDCIWLCLGDPCQLLRSVVDITLNWFTGTVPSEYGAWPRCDAVSRFARDEAVVRGHCSRGGRAPAR